MTSLHWACKKFDIFLLLLLIDHGALTRNDSGTKEQFSCVKYVSENKSINRSVVATLLSMAKNRQIDINKPSGKWLMSVCLLSLCLKNDATERTIERLIENGADVNFRNDVSIILNTPSRTIVKHTLP